MKTTLTILFSLFLITPCVFGQYGDRTIGELKKALESETNSLNKGNIYSELINRYMRIDTDSMLIFANEFKEFADTEDNDLFQLNAHYNLGRYYAVKGIADTAILNLEQAYNLTAASTDSAFIGKVIGMMGYVYYFNEQYDAAVRFYNESIEYFKQSNDSRSEAIAVSTLGSVFYQLGDYASAKNKYLESLKIKEELKDTLLMSTDIKNLGLIYRNEGRLDSSLIFTNRALEMDLKLNNVSGLSGTYGDLSSIYLEKGDFQKANQYAEESLKKAEEVNSLYRLGEAYEQLYVVYKEWGRAEEALANYELFKTFSDSIVNSETRQQLVEAQEKYAAEKKEQAIKLLEAENLTIRFQVILAVVIGISLLVIVSFIFWIVNKHKAAKRELQVVAIQRELESYGTLIAEKDSYMSEIVEKLKSMGSELKSVESRKELSRLINDLQQNVDITDGEEELFSRIEQVNKGFFRELELITSSLTKNDKRLASLAQMDLSNKEISGILHITPRSVNQARYRLKKKLNLDPDDSLKDFLRSLGR